RIGRVRDHRREYLEEGAALLPARDVYESCSLIGRCALVDRQLPDAVSLVNSPRPPVRRGKGHAVELGRPVVALMNVNGDERLALPVRGRRVELARASPGTITRASLLADDSPWSHNVSPDAPRQSRFYPRIVARSARK